MTAKEANNQTKSDRSKIPTLKGPSDFTVAKDLVVVVAVAIEEAWDGFP
jgi:hypothetical protein